MAGKSLPPRQDCSKRPPHLFIASESSGPLFDTRGTDWSKGPPLRTPYSATFRKITNLAELKATLRNGAYAWPGGYPLYFIMADGEAMAWDSVRAEFRQIAEAFRDMQAGAHDRDWIVTGCGVNWEDGGLHCAHTNKRIESAYAEPEATSADDTGREE